MSDLIQIAASGIRGYRASLDAVGENVANASSPGYARRSAALTGTDPGSTGPLVRPDLGGLGVSLTGLKRAHDAFLAADARGAEADNARLAAQSTWLGEFETTLAAGGQDVGTGITAFYNAGQALAAEPGSTVARTQFLQAADSVATRFRDASAGLDRTDGAIGKQLVSGVAGVNGLAQQIATLNGRLRRAEPDTAQSASLLDQRDASLTDLSRLIAIDVREGDRGQVTVRLGTAQGATLIDGTSAQTLATLGNTILLGKARADVSGQIVGGSLGGTLGGAHQLATTRTALDNLANDFATAINSAHASGVDLAGTPGGAVFATTTVSLAASPANTGAATIAATVAPGSTLAAQGYALRYDGAGAQWTLAHADGSNAVGGTGTLTLDGLTLTLGGAPADADTYRLASRAGAAGIAAAITDPARVAAADPFIAGPALANAGSGTIIVTADAAATALPASPGGTWRVQMVDATNFQIVDPASGTVLAAAQPLAPGTAVKGHGFTFALTGTPVAGDSFDIAPALNASGDAGGIARLLATRTAPVGTAPIEDRFDRASNAVSNQLADVKIAAKAATAILDTANSARDGASGVNLDAEATDLVRFQQAYQASAKVIQTARDIFNQLLQIG